MNRAHLLVLTLALAACHASSSGTAAPVEPIPAPAPAPAEAKPAIGGRTVPLAGGGSGWFEAPPAAGKHPALLVLQEWWGLNDWIKEDVARFAQEGYVVLAVDLYRGKVAADPGEAHELMRGLPEDRAMGDMKAGFEWLAARPDVDPSRIGVIGWCMGGGYALAFAVAEPRLKAAVVNYGKLVTDPAKLESLHASLLGNFAGQDRGIEPKDVQAFADTLKADHKDVDVKVYPGAKHAFMNPNNKDGYDDSAAKDAWSRILGFFAAKLSPR